MKKNNTFGFNIGLEGGVNKPLELLEDSNSPKF
jgi:hypothetical protein